MKTLGRQVGGNTTKLALVCMLGLCVLGLGAGLSGPLDPTNAPGPTMHTLDEIYTLAEAIVSPKALSADTTTVQAGYYAATNLTQVDPDLAAENIVSNVTIFGIAGTASAGGSGAAYPAPVPKTGQTASYGTGDDGDLERGVASPIPRFTDNGDGTVTDSLTGLMWTKDATIVGSKLTWSAAVNYCRDLEFADHGDWRLPNVQELLSLVSFGGSMPPTGHPFLEVSGYGYYWSSTTVSYSSGSAWCANNISWIGSGTKSSTGEVWPVRGGE